MNGWKMKCPFGAWPIFRGKLAVSFRECVSYIYRYYIIIIIILIIIIIYIYAGLLLVERLANLAKRSVRELMHEEELMGEI